MVLETGKFTLKVRAFLFHHPIVKGRKAWNGKSESKRETKRKPN
jgi:hypothetical protein